MSILTARKLANLLSFFCRDRKVSNACDWLRQYMAQPFRNASPSSPSNYNKRQILIIDNTK